MSRRRARGATTSRWHFAPSVAGVLAELHHQHDAHGDQHANDESDPEQHLARARASRGGRWIAHLRSCALTASAIRDSSTPVDEHRTYSPEKATGRPIASIVVAIDVVPDSAGLTCVRMLRR